jgi:hypothetical protein
MSDTLAIYDLQKPFVEPLAADRQHDRRVSTL